jgi:hypothetical protein
MSRPELAAMSDQRIIGLIAVSQLAGWLIGSMCGVVGLLGIITACGLASAIAWIASKRRARA